MWEQFFGLGKSYTQMNVWWYSPGEWEMPVKLRDIIKRIEQDGWIWKRTSGSHRIYKHPTKHGTVVVAYHGAKDVPEGTLKNILRQAGLDE